MLFVAGREKPDHEVERLAAHGNVFFHTPCVHVGL